MFKTIRNAFKVKELREKILYTLMMLVVIRFGCQLPIPGIETTFFKDWFAKQTADVFGFFNAMTGDSFSNMSIFALSITPYITSSIIIQLLTIAIPKLEEMQKDGEEGRKKIQEYTRYTTVALALLESSAMAIGFGRQGLLHDFNAWNVIIAVITMTTGSALLMWIGEQITSKGVGNGISIVLLFNILSSIPDDIKSLYYRFIFGQSIPVMAGAAILIALVIVMMVVFVVVLNNAEQTADVFGFFNAMTGDSFSNMSIFALSITPYITSSIIIQLLTIAIPKLEEMQKDGEEGRKKIQEYTRYTTVALALLESSAMAIGFGRQGLLHDFNAWNVIIAVITMTTGSALLMWIGEQITSKGVGNGISIVLLFNILSSIPDDIKSLYYRFIFGQSIPVMAGAAILIALVIVMMVVFVVVLNNAERRIPVQYSKKMVGRKMVGGQASNIPLKINTAGVMPVIFASSIMSFPVVISQFFPVDYNTIGGKILTMLNSGSWCRPSQPIYSIGLVIYIVLLFVFAYFYTSITFNPLEVANNMKKQGGFIPGIRPGKPTSDYLNHILNYIVFIGAVGLTVVAVVPILASGLLDVGQISFSGTSLIIIVGVVLETIKAIESQMLVRYYKGFLND